MIWMDLGVGSFVFSAGIVAAKPFLKRPENRFKPLGGQLINACKHAFPLFVLGFARLIAVKGVDYQEHVSEYGVHWNFFFTLAFLPIFVTLCRAVERYARFAVLGLVIIAVYQLALSSFGLEDYIQNAPRTNLISANKEGIFSFFGYLAIFIFAFDTGHYILPADPYYAFRQNRKPSIRPKQRKLAMILFSYAILWSIGFMVALVCGIRVSRQMANLGYVFWVAVYNTGFLCLFQLVELMFFDRYWVKEGLYVPHIIEAFNTNGLAVFILANLLTGLINLTIRTLYASTIIAESIICGYMFTISLVAVLCWKKGWILKI